MALGKPPALRPSNSDDLRLLGGASPGDCAGDPTLCRVAIESFRMAGRFLGDFIWFHAVKLSIDVNLC